MGNWAIIIRGTGAHHNQGKDGKYSDTDAQVLAEQCVRDLLAAGQRIETAAFHHSAQDLLGRPDLPAEAGDSVNQSVMLSRLYSDWAVEQVALRLGRDEANAGLHMDRLREKARRHLEWSYALLRGETLVQDAGV